MKIKAPRPFETSGSTHLSTKRYNPEKKTWLLNHTAVIAGYLEWHVLTTSLFQIGQWNTRDLVPICPCLSPGIHCRPRPIFWRHVTLDIYRVSWRYATHRTACTALHHGSNLPHWLIYRHYIKYRARGGTVGWGTALQADSRWASLEFFIVIILLVALWTWSRLSLWQKYFLGVKAAGA